MDRQTSASIHGEGCERCGYPMNEHHVGDVCVARGARGIPGLPWALRAVQLSGEYLREVEERRSQTRRQPA